VIVSSSDPSAVLCTRETNEHRARSHQSTGGAPETAGHQLILERTFESISTRGVADLARCNHGSITRHFGIRPAPITSMIPCLVDEIGATRVRIETTR